MKTIMNENNQQQKEVEMEEKQIESMLDDVYKLILKHGGLKQREPFNVFELCGVWSSEMRHSAILRELLDPQGMHGFKTKFLEAFFKQIGLEFDPNGCRAKTEVAYSNGRMDIVISSGDVAVVIENKIYAGDQEDQLKRYKEEWLEAQSGKKQALLYLTLDGHEASNAEHVDYQRISYRNDILAWLETCIEMATEKPLVKSALEQYKELIKKLTGEHMDPSMKDAVTSATTANAQNYLAAALTAKAFDGIHQNVLRDIVKEASEETRNEEKEWLCEKEMDWKIGTNNNKQFSISYTPKGKQYKLFFEFQKGNYQDLYYGLHDLNSDNGPHPYKAELLTIPEDFKRDFGENEIGKKANNHGWIVYIIASDTDKTMWTPESLALKHWKNNFADLKDKIKLYIKDLIAIINQNKEKLDNPNQQ